MELTERQLAAEDYNLINKYTKDFFSEIVITDYQVEEVYADTSKSLEYFNFKDKKMTKPVDNRAWQ